MALTGYFGGGPSIGLSDEYTDALRAHRREAAKLVPEIWGDMVGPPSPPPSPPIDLFQMPLPAPAPPLGASNAGPSPIPGEIVALARQIDGVPKKRDGLPSRNKLRRDKTLQAEISRKTGHLKVQRRGGRLRSWYGDERLFSQEMWSWLAPHHQEEQVDDDDDADDDNGDDDDEISPRSPSPPPARAPAPRRHKKASRYVEDDEDEDDDDDENDGYDEIDEYDENDDYEEIDEYDDNFNGKNENDDFIEHDNNDNEDDNEDDDDEDNNDHEDNNNDDYNDDDDDDDDDDVDNNVRLPAAKRLPSAVNQDRAAVTAALQTNPDVANDDKNDDGDNSEDGDDDDDDVDVRPPAAKRRRVAINQNRAPVAAPPSQKNQDTVVMNADWARCISGAAERVKSRKRKAAAY